MDSSSSSHSTALERQYVQSFSYASLQQEVMTELRQQVMHLSPCFTAYDYIQQQRDKKCRVPTCQQNLLKLFGLLLQGG